MKKVLKWISITLLAFVLVIVVFGRQIGRIFFHTDEQKDYVVGEESSAEENQPSAPFEPTTIEGDGQIEIVVPEGQESGGK